MSGGLRKKHRRVGYVRVWNEAVDDARLSMRALGLLVVLLRKPDGWAFRAEQLAAESPSREGRDAIQTAMRELCSAGYYRVERRQRRDGTFSMGTAVSDVADPDWAEQYAEYGGKPVTVVEQEDGTWKVRRKSGDLVDDGFTETGISGPGTETGKPGPGFSGRTPPPKPGNPGPGNPGPDNPVSLPVQVSHSGQPEPDSLRSSGDEVDAAATLDGMPAPPPPDPKRVAGKRAQAIVREWFDWRTESGYPRAPQGFGACTGIVRECILNAQWDEATDTTVVEALKTLTTGRRPLTAATLMVAMESPSNVTVLRQRPVTEDQTRQQQARTEAF